MTEKITRILVVDGSTVSRQILSRILRDEMTNIEVDSCKTGADAIKKMQDIDYDLITTALLLPDMDGFMLAERIRACPQLDDCILIVLSSAGQTENQVRRQELRIAHYLIKPVNPRQVLMVITRLLEGDRIRQQRLSRDFVTRSRLCRWLPRLRSSCSTAR